MIVGITGDLSRRKLLPAIEKIVAAGAAPRELHVIGITRREVTADEILSDIKTSTDFLKRNLEMYQMDLASPDDYVKLKSHLDSTRKEMGASTQTLFYLSVPPQISQPIITSLGTSGISRTQDTKLLLEKPFGVDLESAEELVEHVKSHFDEDQVYRIDHYLAKEMTQNVVVFRQGNSLFKRAWNNEFVESIEIIASENIGIEGRAEFYEQTGALRDVVQSHLMQLAALVLADFPSVDWSTIPEQRLRALQQLMAPQDIDRDVVRGQYAGYKDEVQNPHSVVETFVSVTLNCLKYWVCSCPNYSKAISAL